MKKYFSNSISVFIILLSPVLAQEPDSLIQLYPGMADNISYVDKTYFGLYNQIEGFENATIFIRNHRELVSRVTISENGFLRDTVLINDLSVLENKRFKIKEIIEESDEKIEYLHSVMVTTLDGRLYEGVLEAFSKDHLYLLSDKNSITNQDSEFKYRLPLSNISQVTIKGETNYLNPVLWGTGIGFATGVLAPIGMSVLIQETLDPESEPDIKFDSELFISGFVCALIGAGIGYVIGLLTAEEDVPINFTSERSVLKLRNFAHYKFQNLKTFEEDYQEMDY